MQNIYDSRSHQADKLTAELKSFEPILGDFVPDIRPPALDEADLAAADASFTEGEVPMAAMPLSYLTQLSSAIDKCGHELTRRSEELQTHLYEILGLWSELCLAPNMGDDGQEATFDALVLRHLRLQTVWETVELDEGGTTMEFQGTFLPLEGGDGDDAMAAPDTPSRSGGSGSGTLQSMRSAETHFPPHVLQPTPDNIARANAKRQWLEDEKSRREARIQELYDDLFQLWVKFEVPEEDMDRFVMSNSGSTMAVIQTYEGELEKMVELKQQHMALFIGKVRERIDELWGELRLSAEQREMTFPDFFARLDDVAPADLDLLLQRHEERVVDLEAEVERKAPLLKLVARYLDLCEEEKQLEESAKDTSRLMKGVRGDPGRLLREEKMRKRVKIQKPKLEAELLKAIPGWESECGQTFTIDGEPYYEKILALSSAGAAAAGADAAGGKKRSRVASVATPSAHQNGNGVLLQSAQANRMAPTPMRTPSTATGRGGVPASTGGMAGKKPRLVTASAAKGTPAAPPTAASVGNLRARVAPTPASTSRLPSSSRIPMPGAAPAGQQFSGRAKVPPTAAAAAASSSSSSGKNAAAALASASTSGYAAGHSFRPRPSQINGPMMARHQHQQPLPRNMSGTSIASDATTLCYPSTAGAPAAYAQAIPSRPPVSSSAPRRSVNHGGGKNRRGPSMSLEGALANGFQPAALGGRPSATIRTVSSEARQQQMYGEGEEEAGGNWAVLEEDDGEEGAMRGMHADGMEVF